MSILKKHVAHPVALLAAIATLASGLTCMTNPVETPSAHADEVMWLFSSDSYNKYNNYNALKKLGIRFLFLYWRVFSQPRLEG